MRDLLQQAAELATRYRETIGDRAVAPSTESLAGFCEPLPEGPSDPRAVLELLDRAGSAATMGVAGPRFFGFVIGGSLPAAVAADWLASAWDQNATLFTVSPVAAALEDVSLGWLLELLGLPRDCGGAFVTGATMANFTALAAARHAIFARAGWDVEAEGLVGAPAITVVVSEEVHPSVTKALGMLGLGRARALSAPVDGQGRIRMDRFPKWSGPAIVCMQAGNVNTGACDPAREICAVAHERGAWVHVDGAFGLWAAAAPERARLVTGVADADSWATDAHKWLNVPQDCGLAFVRDAAALKGAMSLEAAYLPQMGRREPSQYVPELSRRARGITVWAALRSLGRSGVAEMIERTCAHASRFASGLAQAGFEVLNDVVLNQVVVSFGSPEQTRQTIRRIQEDGTCWCGETVWQGRVAMRISVSSWATTEDDVESSLQAMIDQAIRV